MIVEKDQVDKDPITRITRRQLHSLFKKEVMSTNIQKGCPHPDTDPSMDLSMRVKDVSLRLIPMMIPLLMNDVASTKGRPLRTTREARMSTTVPKAVIPA